MAKDKDTSGSFSNPPPEPTPQEKAKAGKWFDHAKISADKLNYDYAIECYIGGLRLWPEAVDAGHKPLRAVGFARLGAGQKKPGMLQRFKFDTMGSGRDALEAMLSAEMLLAKDPTNLNYMEAVLKNAAKGGYEQTCMWLGPIFLHEAISNPKANYQKLPTVVQIFDELGKRYNDRSDAPRTVAALELAVKAAEVFLMVKPDERLVIEKMRDLGGLLAITKGQFERGDFRESLQDAQKQRELQDKDRMHQDDARYEELIQSALQALNANPNEMGRVLAAADLMLRRGRSQDEQEAIQLLMAAFGRTQVYQYKARADDIQMRQLHRQAQAIKERGDRQAATEHIKKMLDFEIGVYLERIHQYPTDVHYKYELGRLYFHAGRYDEAVPVLQLARNDPKNRMACLSLIAQCFYHKGYFEQAINVLLDGIRTYEVVGGDASKDMHYWLGRAYEATGQKEPAIQAYGKIIQWDYNFRNGDVRQRLEALQQDRKLEPGAPGGP